ncbi:hypothetical protein N8445_00075 [bacterium]|nr:hypothetical protein [bacterium]
MAKITYTVIDRDYNSIQENENYSSSDLNLIDNYQINKNYDRSLHYIETHFYSLNDERIFSLYDYNISSDVETDAEGNVTSVALEPEKIAIQNGFTGVDHKIVFHFLNDLYTLGANKLPFFINTISQDRKEVLLYSEQVEVNRLINSTERLKTKLNSTKYFEEVWLNLGENDLFIVTNIDVYELDDKYTVALKLYEPLPDRFEIKHEAQLVEKISDSCIVEIQVDIEDDPEVFPTLRQANFNIELDSDDSVPTEYFNYDELFSYSNSNSNREIFSYLSEKSVDINIDYSTYSNFINFSSAQERLKNFKYKVQLIQTYQSSKDQIENSTNASGSSAKYDNLIKGVIDNLDHYEKYLYYESGSNAWPKSTSVKPHINLHTTSSNAVTWYANQLTSASNYDTSNYDVLTNTLPSYIAEDTNNNNALLFIHMIGQHFDNLWIYTKAVTDKYDNDNRLDVGISKDLVRETLQGFGAKIYNSIEGSNDLFNYLIADTYDSGSTEEVVNQFIQVPGIPSDQQPVSRQNYEGEVYKRIYHNLPFLMKTKGTERGLRALINCFGIPSSFLGIKQYGGDIIGKSKFLGYDESKDSTGKVRVETRASGSVGKVLTLDKSIQKTENDRIQDTHRLEVGFSPSNEIDRYIISQLASTFNIDDYIGDPRDLNKDSYNGLYKFTESILINIPKYNLNDFVRILKFFDNVLFKMIKDFIPAKGTLDTGIIIKPHVLDRSKAKSPEMSGTRPEYDATIDTAFSTGSDGGAYATGRKGIFTQKELESHWPSKIGGISNFTFKPDFSNPTSANPGEITIRGTEFYHPDGTVYTFPDDQTYGTLYTPYEGSVSVDYDFYIMFSSESIKQRFDTAGNSWTIDGFSNAHPHLIPIDYSPNGENSWVARDNAGNISASFTPLANDVIIAASTLEADTDLLSYFVNYTKPLNTIKQGEKTTIHKLDIRTKSGSVEKWVDDESPKLTGELSGSEILISDGELNKQNLFKQVNVPALNYDIVLIDEGNNATYTSFLMDPTPNSGGEAACATNNSTATYYHDDTGSFPVTVGKFVYNDVAGNQTFNVNTADKWYKAANNYSIKIGGTSSGGNQGKVLAVVDCATFDSTAPTGYTATYNLALGVINIANKSAVPFTIYDGELNATYEVTASLDGNATEVKSSGTITNAISQSATFDATGLPDGDDVLLKIRLVDANGNQGSYATRKTANSQGEDLNNTLTASLKDTVAPSATGVDFKSDINYISSATGTNNNGIFYIEVSGLPNNDRGTVNLTLVSTGANATPYTTQQAYNNLSTHTSYSRFVIYPFSHSLPNGTITATANIVDVSGNTSGNYTDSIVYNAQIGSLLVGSTIGAGSSTQYLSVSTTPSTLGWKVTATNAAGSTVSWASITAGTPGTGAGSLQLAVGANASTSSRQIVIKLFTTSNVLLDTKTISQAGTSGGCVAPQTLILMSDGSYKTAGRLEIGDEVKTKDQFSLESINCRVISKKSIHSLRIKVLLEGKEIIVSPEHRFFVDNKNEFIAASKLKDGDILSGFKFNNIEEYEDGEVLEIGVDKARTYISNDILSHNYKTYMGDSSGDGYGNKIICNELYRQGYLPEELWDADERYGEIMFDINPRLVIGYQMWARKVVKLMQKSSLLGRLGYIIFKPWTEYMGYRMGMDIKPTIIGRLTNWIGVRVSYTVFDLYGGQQLLDKYNKIVNYISNDK